MTKRGAKATGENWRDNYRTPPDFIVRAEGMWSTLGDPFPTGHPIPFADGRDYYDAFRDPWPSFVWVNPPFSRYRDAVLHGLRQPTEQLWICGVDNSTKWFQALWDASSGVCLLDKRVHFIDPRTGEPTKGTDIGKGNAIFYRGNSPGSFSRHFMDLGRVIIKTEGKGHVLGI